MYLRNVPLRLATGAFILHSGYEKWGGSREQAEGVHGMASGAFPALKASTRRSCSAASPQRRWPWARRCWRRTCPRCARARR